MKRNPYITAGFTLVEVLVVAPFMALTILVILSFMLNAFLDMSAKSAQLEMETDAQTALFAIRDDILFTNYFAGAIQPDASDPHKTGGWNAIDDNALILSEVAYTANRQNPSRELVYERDNPNPCNALEDGLNPFSTNTLVYFVENETLYMRTIIPDQANNCATTYRTQTCPASAATSTCPADSILAHNVKSFTITYYSRFQDDSLTPVDPLILVDPDTFIRVSRTDLSLTLERMANGKPITTTATISLKKVH